MTLTPGRYTTCQTCGTPQILHDPQCPGWVRGSSSHFGARCCADFAAHLAAGCTWVPPELRKAQQTLFPNPS